MCGIHFVINTDNVANTKLTDFMKDAFIANQVRGRDSSGCYQVKNYLNKDGLRDVSYHKEAECASDFIESNQARNLLHASATSLVTVGHVRHATVGSKTLANAHPFISVREDKSRIIGVHNGTLNNWRTKEGAKDFDVDSEWLFNRLALDGADAFEAFDGAFALVWFDSRHQNKLFVARNEKRPLFYGLTEDRKQMIAASELGMLGWLADRNSIKMQKDKEGFRYFYPPAGSIMEIDLKNLDVNTYKYAEFNAQSKLYKIDTPAVVMGSPRYSSAYGIDRDDDDWGWGGGSRYHGNSVFRPDQDVVLEKIKTAIKQGMENAKKIADEEEEVVTAPFEDTSGFKEALQGEIANFLKDREKGLAPDGDFTFVTSPLADGSASFKERDRARGLGIYGLVVDFCGYFTDPSECIVYGDFETNENGKKYKYDAIVRGQSEKAGDVKYVHPTKMVPMVVIGISAEKATNKGKPFIILSDMDANYTTVHYESLADRDETKEKILH